LGVVLFVSELGSGFGHVRRLLPVAAAAARAGHRPLFLVPNPEEVAAFVTQAGFGLQSTPSGLRRPAGSAPARSVATSFADILGGAGFADPEYLFELTAAWDAAITALGPSAVVCEFSPFLNVATFAARLPVLVLGYGFVLPPPQLPRFPSLRDGAPLYEEPRLLDNVKDVCARRSRPAPVALPALLSGSSHAVTGLGALDPYRADRLHAAVGVPCVDCRPLAEQAPLHDVFGYLLGDSPTTLQVLRVLAASGVRGRVFVRRGSAAQRQALTGSGVTWLEAPEPIRRALGEARVILHHGSMLMSEEALMAGRPQLLIPLYLEHLLTARALRDLGVARVVRATLDPHDIQRGLAAILADGAPTHRAQAFARSFWQRSPPAADLPERLLRRMFG
jgi:UDP:flavonoid glycosyltransferase YjiC (YdhE family)